MNATPLISNFTIPRQFNGAPLTVPPSVLDAITQTERASKATIYRVPLDGLTQEVFQRGFHDYLGRETTSPLDRYLLCGHIFALRDPKSLSQIAAELSPQVRYDAILPLFITPALQKLGSYFQMPMEAVEIKRNQRPYFHFVIENDFTLPFQLYKNNNEELVLQELFDAFSRALETTLGPDSLDFNYMDLLYRSALTLTSKEIGVLFKSSPAQVERQAFAAWPRIIKELRKQNYSFAPVDLTQPLTAKLLGLNSFEFAGLPKSLTLEDLLKLSPQDLLRKKTSFGRSSFNATSVDKIQHALLAMGLTLAQPPQAIRKT